MPKFLFGLLIWPVLHHAESDRISGRAGFWLDQAVATLNLFVILWMSISGAYLESIIQAAVYGAYGLHVRRELSKKYGIALF
ncbi:MAG TPA: hypothetical protein VGB97_00850 [Candidatus Paceibacterota bacterium]|jgi:hypothetical protein